MLPPIAVTNITNSGTGNSQCFSSHTLSQATGFDPDNLVLGQSSHAVPRAAILEIWKSRAPLCAMNFSVSGLLKPSSPSQVDNSVVRTDAIQMSSLLSWRAWANKQFQYQTMSVFPMLVDLTAQDMSDVSGNWIQRPTQKSSFAVSDFSKAGHLVIEVRSPYWEV